MIDTATQRRLKFFLAKKFNELQSKSLTSWEKSLKEYVFDWIDEFVVTDSTTTKGEQ